MTAVTVLMNWVKKTTTALIATGFAKFVIAAAAYTAVKIYNRKDFADERVKHGFSQGVLLIVLSTLLSGLSYILQLNSAKEFPATVLYPLITGGTIIFSSLAGMAFFDDKIS